jgi:signal transduction histidine kinase
VSPAERRSLIGRLRRPQTTVRWRLTLLYGGLFLVSGAALLAITYTLVSHATQFPGGLIAIGPAHGKRLQVHVPNGNQFVRLPPGKVPPGLTRVLGSPAGRAVAKFVVTQQRIADLHHLEVESGIALAIMALISALLGWIVAGRVLRPLRTITATTGEISAANLHERLWLPGPRDELRTLADTIDGLLERLEGAFDAQRRFVANASHELRTPLATVRALLEMAISDPHATVDDFRDIGRQALEENEQQEQLIDALLALAHGQRGIARREPVDVALVTGEVLRAHDGEAAANGLVLDVAIQNAYVWGDRRLIARLISNLVQNAIGHNVPSGQVQVRVENRAGAAAVTVVNTGPVVPTSEITRLLQPFQRLAPDRVGHREGFGLGLSIVSAIAAAHDAALDIQPGERGGLYVELRFPPAPEIEQPMPEMGLPEAQQLAPAVLADR